MKDEDQ